jgi:hypothetical protein
MGAWVRRLGVPEEPVLLTIPTRAIGVPAVEEGGLLVRIGDAGAHPGEEVQGIEDPEVGVMSGVDGLGAVDDLRASRLPHHLLRGDRGPRHIPRYHPGA